MSHAARIAALEAAVAALTARVAKLEPLARVEPDAPTKRETADAVGDALAGVRGRKRVHRFTDDDEL